MPSVEATYARHSLDRRAYNNRRRRRLLALARQEQLRKDAASSPPERKPGFCMKCGKHIGRGVRWHEKACAGLADSQ